MSTEKTAEAWLDGECIEADSERDQARRAKSLAALLDAEREKAEARTAEVEAYGVEYIERTDPLISCSAWVHGGENDPHCGTCRGCYLERAEKAESALAAKDAELRELAKTLGQRDAECFEAYRVLDLERGFPAQGETAKDEENARLREALWSAAASYHKASKHTGSFSSAPPVEPVLRDPFAAESHETRCPVCGIYGVQEGHHHPVEPAQGEYIKRETVAALLVDYHCHEANCEVCEILRTVAEIVRDRDDLPEEPAQETRGLTFSQLRAANTKRLPQFKNRRGEPAHSQPDGSDWKISEWTNAMAGEAGEACNVAKKIIRGDYDREEDGIRALAKELADVVTYADITAFRIGIDLGRAVQEKFNEVSARFGCAMRLPEPAPTETARPKYDPAFGDERPCACTHTYYRHFDSYDEMNPIGCKYCDCRVWREPDPAPAETAKAEETVTSTPLPSGGSNEATDAERKAATTQRREAAARAGLGPALPGVRAGTDPVAGVAGRSPALHSNVPVLSGGVVGADTARETGKGEPERGFGAIQHSFANHKGGPYCTRLVPIPGEVGGIQPCGQTLSCHAGWCEEARPEEPKPMKGAEAKCQACGHPWFTDAAKPGKCLFCGGFLKISGSVDSAAVPQPRAGTGVATEPGRIGSVLNPSVEETPTLPLGHAFLSCGIPPGCPGKLRCHWLPPFGASQFCGEVEAAHLPPLTSLVCSLGTPGCDVPGSHVNCPILPPPATVTLGYFHPGAPGAPLPKLIEHEFEGLDRQDICLKTNGMRVCGQLLPAHAAPEVKR